ncbi:D-Ala-D-Ala carboxypeptidase family metallohydrolase [Alteromonas sp.]|nr:D-Ala-D-Ala carboxypeptidase family metallohydrolase [Alteromonas sp.]
MMKYFLPIIFVLMGVGLALKASAAINNVLSHPPVLVEDADAQQAKFQLQAGKIVIPYKTFSIFVLPGETVELEVLFPQANTQYELISNAGDYEKKGLSAWRWQSPKTSGMYNVCVRATDGSSEIALNVFTMTPSDNMVEGKLRYYHIGHYPDESITRNREMYIEPEGFIEVTKANQDVKLSPHFQLKEFVSKQKSEFPKFVYLQSSLLLKLEKLRTEMNLRNIRVDNMVVMSGYRTPYYNKAIGNVALSRHVFGDAADIFIDNDGNYRMDDLNNDGKSSIADAQLIAEVINELNKRNDFRSLIGGLGIYGPKPHRGPFIHVDTRGVKARWTSP